MSFNDKVAIITGAASGMGLLSAQELAKDGAKVLLTDVNAEAVEAAAEAIRRNGGEAIGLQVDVRKYEQVKNAADTALEKFGRVDLILYLCSEKAAFITGSNYMIDGGRTLGGMD